MTTLERHGFQTLSPMRAESALALDRAFRQQREFDSSLFLTEAEFDADPQWKGVNPHLGRNLLSSTPHLGYFASAWYEFLDDWLGLQWTVKDAKLVCGVPKDQIPAWIAKRTETRQVNNLGPFIRPELRDVTYFGGIDWHQDIIDHPASPADFLTLYVYLHRVGEKDAPLRVLPGSHTLGAKTFPHQQPDLNKFAQVALFGAPGHAAIWHPCTLHRTGYVTSERARLSIRYLIQGDGGRLADLNRDLGIAALAETRHDLAPSGATR